MTPTVRAGGSDALDRVGDPVDQPALAVGKGEDALGPEGDGLAPELGVVRVPAREDDARPPSGAA